MTKVLFLVILFLFSSSANVFAATTPTPTKPQPSVTVKETLDKKLTDQINNLKEKIASRVSELNLVERRGMLGVITEVSGNKITLKDIYGNTRFVDVDEITKFSSSTNKTFGLSDLTKGTRVSVLGLYNKQSKRILARFINTTIDPTVISGTLASIDEKNFQAVIIAPSGKQVKIDIQTTTKIFTVTADTTIEKTGFSKLQIGNRILVIGYPDKKDASLLVVSRLLAFPKLTKNPKIIISEPSPTLAKEDTPTPTTKP